VLPSELEEMEKTDPMAFRKLGCSNNLTKSLMEKKENLVVQILATKFHTEPADEPRASKEIRLNPIMKDLIIKDMQTGHTCKLEKVKGTSDRRMRLKLKWSKVLGKANLLGLTL
jgi:hypothetical protein